MNHLRLTSAVALALLAGACQTPPGLHPTAGPAAPAAIAAPPPVPAVAPAQVAGPAEASGCRDDVEDATVVTDRGIGGTGILPDGARIVERGIGGTGATRGLVHSRAMTAERGGGGTGIVGTITGFGSVCLDGLEVGVEAVTAISEDGAPSRSGRLRLGEVAAIDARDIGEQLDALSIAVRHEVSGPMTAQADPTAGSGGARVLTVAGQRVLVPPGVHMPDQLGPGDWVAVSGLRDLNGDVHASRLDRREPGVVIVAGYPHRVGGDWAMGALRLLIPGHMLAEDQRVIVSGRYAGERLSVESTHVDRFLEAAAPRHRFVVESFATQNGPRVRLAQGVAASLGPDFGAAPPPDLPVVVELTNAPGGMLVALGWHEAATSMPHGGNAHDAPAKPATPAPQPQTSMQPLNGTASSAPAATAVSANATTADSSSATAAAAAATATVSVSAATPSSSAQTDSASAATAANASSTTSATASATPATTTQAASMPADAGASKTSASSTSAAAPTAASSGSDGKSGGSSGNASGSSGGGAGSGSGGAGSSGAGSSGAGSSGAGGSGSGASGSGNGGSGGSGSGGSGSGGSGSGANGSGSSGSGASGSGTGMGSGSGTGTGTGTGTGGSGGSGSHGGKGGGAAGGH